MAVVQIGQVVVINQVFDSSAFGVEPLGAPGWAFSVQVASKKEIRGGVSGNGMFDSGSGEIVVGWNITGNDAHGVVVLQFDVYANHFSVSLFKIVPSGVEDVVFDEDGHSTAAFAVRPVVPVACIAGNV